jgi:hypothetical protein
LPTAIVTIPGFGFYASRNGIHMFKSRTKNDLIIEVWERLDCESVGAAELIAIEDAVRERYGESAVDSPMVLARLLADEGAELRHSEIMELYVNRRSDTEIDTALRNILDISDLRTTLSSLRRCENLRSKWLRDENPDGIRKLKAKAMSFRDQAADEAVRDRTTREQRLMSAEIAEWITIWLGSPELFDPWVRLRRSSEEFVDWFGRDGAGGSE